MAKKPNRLTKRYNANNTISLINKHGRVVFNSSLFYCVDAFCEGYFDTKDRSKWRFNKTQFRYSKKG